MKGLSPKGVSDFDCQSFLFSFLLRVIVWTNAHSTDENEKLRPERWIQSVVVCLGGLFGSRYLAGFVPGRFLFLIFFGLQLTVAIAVGIGLGIVETTIRGVAICTFCVYYYACRPFLGFSQSRVCVRLAKDVYEDSYVIRVRKDLKSMMGSAQVTILLKQFVHWDLRMSQAPTYMKHSRVRIH